MKHLRMTVALEASGEQVGQRDVVGHELHFAASRSMREQCSAQSASEKVVGLGASPSVASSPLCTSRSG